jgi:hypothetical protein
VSSARDELLPPAGSPPGGADAAGLAFVAEMYGVPLDQLAAALRVSPRRAGDIAARWVARRLAEAGRLAPGPRWVWLTRAGLTACGLSYAPSPPALPRLAHLRAVIAVRLALEAVPAYQQGAAYWRGERRLRTRLGGRLGQRDHLPDAEVHWPELWPGEPGPGEPRAGEPGAGEPGAGEPGAGEPGAGQAGAMPGWAGECWAIEAELTPKTVTRTTAIMAELLTRTGDYGSPAAEARVPGRPPRHDRIIYLCSPAAAGTVSRARAALGEEGARIEIRGLPGSGYLPAPGSPAGG